MALRLDFRFQYQCPMFSDVVKRACSGTSGIHSHFEELENHCHFFPDFWRTTALQNIQVFLEDGISLTAQRRRSCLHK